MKMTFLFSILLLVFVNSSAFAQEGTFNNYLSSNYKNHPINILALSGEGGEGGGGGGPKIQQELRRLLDGQYGVRSFELAAREQRGFEIVVPARNVFGVSSNGVYVDVMDYKKTFVPGFVWENGQLKIEVRPGAEGTVYLQNGREIDLQTFMGELSLQIKNGVQEKTSDSRDDETEPKSDDLPTIETLKLNQ